MRSIEATVMQLELELLQPACRSDTQRLDALLADDFLEVGATGRSFGKADVLSRLPHESGITFEATDMEALVQRHRGWARRRRTADKVSLPNRAYKVGFQKSRHFGRTLTMNWKNLLLPVALAVVAGCATPPVLTLEERLDSSFAKRPFPREMVERVVPYHVSLVYAHAAWQQLADPELPALPAIDIQSTLEVPLAVFDYYTLGTGPALLGFLGSFGSTDIKGDQQRAQYSATLPLISSPNTHYYLFDSREGTATPEDVDFAWDQAYRIVQEVYNRDGRCYVNFWTPERHYSGTQVRNARGVFKKVDFRCTHTLYPDGPDQLVSIEAWGNPFDGIRVLAAIHARCWVLKPDGEPRFRDHRDCGEKLAARQRPYLPDTELPLAELVTTPTAADPTVFQVVGRHGERVTVLPAPDGLHPEYVEFLASIPYTVED